MDYTDGNDADSGDGYQEVTIIETESKTELKSLKRSIDSLKRESMIMKSLTEYIFTDCELESPSNRSLLESGVTEFMDEKNRKRMKPGLQNQYEISHHLSQEQTGYSELGFLDQRREESRKHIQQEPQHATDSAEGGILSSAHAAISETQKLKQSYDKLKSGVKILNSIALHFNEEDSVSSHPDLPKIATANGVKASIPDLNSSTKPESLFPKEGVIEFLCSTCNMINNAPIEECDEIEAPDKGRVEGQKLDCILLDIVCFCGSQFQILVTEDHVCFPVPFCTQQGSFKHDIPKLIWGWKSADKIEAMIECLFCKRQFSCAKVGKSVKFKFDEQEE